MDYDINHNRRNRNSTETQNIGYIVTGLRLWMDLTIG